ncbi:WD40-repeat-containing domain protein [Halteromyces radiatus]|uniref:WD40-repeat-containing domain protein n=1 Tax=Halteromyces radiatus TaxID=101107 RepID=UPI00221F814E|nr:WD40-repeat-containing domain protein [Halteromyces radiatus]KAI8093369.1 WD40-repeat-containing domain protein [Halteromyces radiatus]
MLGDSLEYSLPGVLHYLQAEWRRFERERNEWAIERAELKARIALLEGERRGVENLKTDLIKRVKMLEYALRQERKKNIGISSQTKRQLPYVTSTNLSSMSPTMESIADSKMREKSQQTLKACLKEINYLTSMPTKLPLTYTLANSVRNNPNNRNSTQQQQQQQQQSSTNNNNNNNNNTQNDTPIQQNNSPTSPTAQTQIRTYPTSITPTMINDKKNQQQSKSSKKMQEKYNISDEKVQKMLRNASKGHLDSVRAVAFHPNEMLVASGSDDGTVKIINLQRSTGADGTTLKKSHEDLDATATYRGHSNIVTGVAISGEQNRVYSSSLDATIRVWRLPSEQHGTFSPVDPSLYITTFIGHTDAIWDFKLSPNSNLLASASADGKVKIWDTQGTTELLKRSWGYEGTNVDENEQDYVAPTCLDFCRTDVNKLVVSYTNAKIRLFDIETGKVVLTFTGSDDDYDSTCKTQINKVVSHPTMPLIVSGHEDRQIRFFDINSGKSTFKMSAHLDAVTSLDMDPSGMTFVSGGHDSSIRLWDMAMTKTCIQEFSAHRKKGDEGVLDIQYHRSFPWMVSGGADGIVKIYHHGQ